MIYHQFRTTDKGIGKLSFVLLVIKPNAGKGDVDDQRVFLTVAVPVFEHGDCLNPKLTDFLQEGVTLSRNEVELKIGKTLRYCGHICLFFIKCRIKSFAEIFDKVENSIGRTM